MSLHDLDNPPARTAADEAAAWRSARTPFSTKPSADQPGWQRWFFVTLALVVSTVLVVWLRKLQRHETWVAIAIVLILGGALGNVYDRVVHGYVVDFLHFYWRDWHFPAFNLADTAITIGAAMMILDLFRKPTDDGGNAERSETHS
ncbi:signal peptidase II [Marinobacter sp.]|uniref:signal peptidase II n=1 Tax=Marinobacter sp. TaxID=50741 RepID=UPI0035C7881F